MTGETDPRGVRVTIGIPLYAARPWVDRIVDNIARNAAPDVEFVLSDQHGLDDALDVVRQRVDGRARLRALSSRTRGGWIDNYNLLLREARGDYLRILSQDDVLLEGSLDHARAALDADPATVLVVGPTDLIDEAGEVIWRDVPASASPLRPIGWTTTADALFVFAGFHNVTLGLIRRAIVSAAGLSIPRTAGESGLSLRALLFAVALRGRVRYEPGYVSRRCVHPSSYTARHWSRSFGDEWRRTRSYWQTGTALWRATFTTRSARLFASPILGAATGHMVARRALQRFSAEVRVVMARQRAPQLRKDP